MKRIAIISEHASPLACIGGVDAGGQNIYVAHVARQLGRLGHAVDVFTRREDVAAPEIAAFDRASESTFDSTSDSTSDSASGSASSPASIPTVRVIHVPAGPAR